MRMITFHVMGQKITLPQFKKCAHCHKLKCEASVYGYPEFCPACKRSAWYRKREKKADEERRRDKLVADGLKANKPVAVFEYKGREIFVNHKGNIITDTPIKPRELGRKDWKY